MPHLDLAVLLASSFLLVPVALAQVPGKSAAHPERDGAGLRGPVKTVTTETQHEFNGRTSISIETVEYTSDGHILRRSQKFDDHPEWISINRYDPVGGLLETITGTGDIPEADRHHTVYTHYKDGRIEARSGNALASVSRTDDQGRRIDIQNFPEIAPRSDVAVAGPSWFDSGLGLPAPSGGRFEIHYDQHGFALDGCTYDSNGQETARVVRTYDDQNRPVRDEVTARPVMPGFPAEITNQMNPEQLQALASFWASGFSGFVTYKYDSRGLLHERKMSGNMRGDVVSTFEYNQHGDKTLEHTTSTESPSFGMEYGITEDGQMIPDRKVPLPPPQVSEMRYEYVYDSRGNWTEQRVNGSFSVESAPRSPQVIKRTLTYYEDPK